MFRTILTTLLMIEGGLFLSAGLAPGVEEMIRTALSQHPNLLPADKQVELIGFFAWLRSLAIGYGLLCAFGGWGAARRTQWGRWTAVIASIGNVLVFVPLGIAGLIVLRKAESRSEDSEKSAPAASEEPEPASHVFVMLASLAIVMYASHALRKFGASQGLPVKSEESLALIWILAGQLIFTLFHELGHLVAAWVVGFKFHEINVGPFTLTERPGGSWRFRFQYQRLLMAGGYLQAVPRTEKGLRMNWILLVLAGPAASLFAGMIGFLTLVSLPGTPYAIYWNWAAFVTAICVADCIANLIPLGSSDGAILLHTTLKTKRGKGILTGLEAAMLNDRVGRSEGLMDPIEILEARPQGLADLETNPEASELSVAVQGMEFAQAALQKGRAEEAAAALEESGKKLVTMQGVPNIVWFRYWADSYETATTLRRYSSAANSRQKALEYGDKLNMESLDWDTLVPVQLGRARLMMSNGDFLAAASAIQETRAACPARGAVTAFAAELLAMEGECELRLGRQAEALTLTKTCIEIAQALPDGQREIAMELLAHRAVRLSAAGDYAFAKPMFEATVLGIECPAAGSVSAGYRTAWAEALYENGSLAESKEVLAPLESSALGVSADIDTLRAQLLLAEDRPADAVEALNPLLSAPSEGLDERRQVMLARSRALRSWALFRSGALEGAIADARQACDVLMPLEHPDSAPALLTLAMAVERENMNLAEAYLQESSRLIFDSTLLSPLTKASRLTDLARSVVQVGRKDWGKRLLDTATRVKAEPIRGASYMGAGKALETTV